mgnify:CR=1 FL=1
MYAFVINFNYWQETSVIVASGYIIIHFKLKINSFYPILTESTCPAHAYREH